MATTTCSVFDQTPQGRSVHAGVNWVGGQYSNPLTASAGDIVFLAKIPHGAKIVEFWEDHSTGATSAAVSFGLANGGAAGGGASLSCLIASGAQATKNRYSVLGAPHQVSVSDNNPNKYGVLAAKLTEAGTATTSLFINFMCMYVTDGA